MGGKGSKKILINQIKSKKIMEIIQVVLSSLLLLFMGWMTIGSLIQAGGFMWYHPLLFILVILCVILLALSIREIKR